MKEGHASKPPEQGAHDKEHATRKSGRWGAEQEFDRRGVPSECDSRRANPKGPEYEQGGAYPGDSYESRNKGGSGGGQIPPDPDERTIGNHPADPNRLGADWNLLPPGIAPEEAKDPGANIHPRPDERRRKR